MKLNLQAATYRELTSFPVLRTVEDKRKTAVFKNPRLRLLMKVVGFERLSPSLDEEIGSAWIIPPRHSAEDLAEYRDLVNKAESSPPAFDDGATAEDQVRRKTAPRRKAVYDDDADEDIDDILDDGDDPLFPRNLKMSKPVGPGHDKPSKKRRRRRGKHSGSGDDDDELAPEEDDELHAERARKRRKRDLEKQRKIKSALYVNPSDDESDAEADAIFFAREEAIRQRVKKALANVPTDASQLQDTVAPPKAIEETMRRLMADSDDEIPGRDEDGGTSDEDSSRTSVEASAGRRKRKSDAIVDEDDELISPPPPKKRAAPAKKTRGGFLADSSDEDDDMDDAEPSSPAHDSNVEEEDAYTDGDEMETDDTPLSPKPKGSGKEGAAAERRSPLVEKTSNTLAAQNDTGDEDEDDVPVASKRRSRVKSGFVVDSSDEE